MPTIVEDPAGPVNGPPVPPELLPVQGPPAPPAVLPVQPAPVAAIPGQLSQNPPAPPADPLALSRQAIGDVAGATAAQQKAVEDEAKAQAEKNDADAKAADAAAADLRKQHEDNDRRMQASEQARARLVELADKADKDVGSFKFTDYGDTIPVGKKIGLIIGAGLAGLGGQADPLAQINKAIAQHFETQKAELSSKESFAKYRRQGIDDHDRHVNDQRLYLEFQERNYREAIAKEAEARGLRSGNPVALAKAQQLAAKIRADGDAKMVELAGKYIQGEEARAHGELLRTKARGLRSGGVGGDGMAKLVDAAQRGDSQGDLVKLALKLKVKDPLGTVKKLRADLKPDQAVEVDEKSVVRDEKGVASGTAPTSRAVPQLERELRTLPRAIEQLKRLREKKWVSSKAPEFHGAVLAVASTTSAGSTDANVAHEKGTLTDAFGLPDNGAIDAKIAELEEQYANAKNQLNPLPDGYVDKKKRPAATGGGEAKPAGAAPSKYNPGAVVEQGGQKYRFKGGDSNDPKNWAMVL